MVWKGQSEVRLVTRPTKDRLKKGKEGSQPATVLRKENKGPKSPKLRSAQNDGDVGKKMTNGSGKEVGFAFEWKLTVIIKKLRAASD